MRIIKSDLEYSQFPMKLGIAAGPSWKRRKRVPGPGPGNRVRRSDQVDADANEQADQVQSNSDKGDS